MPQVNDRVRAQVRRGIVGLAFRDRILVAGCALDQPSIRSATAQSSWPDLQVGHFEPALACRSAPFEASQRPAPSMMGTRGPIQLSRAEVDDEIR